MPVEKVPVLNNKLTEVMAEVERYKLTEGFTVPPPFKSKHSLLNKVLKVEPA